MELKVVIHAIYGTQKSRLICLDQLYIILTSLKNWTDLADST